MATIPRRMRTPRPAGVNSEFTEKTVKWWTNKQLVKRIEAEQDGDKKDPAHPGLRRWLLDQIVKTGRKVDPKGHMAVTFPQQLNGLYGLMAQRKTTTGFNQVYAAGLLSKLGKDAENACSRVIITFAEDAMPLIVKTLKEAGVYDTCVLDAERKLDPDLIFRYHAKNQDKLTAEDLDLIFPDTVDWALIPLTEPLGELGDVD